MLHQYKKYQQFFLFFTLLFNSCLQAKTNTNNTVIEEEISMQNVLSLKYWNNYFIYFLSNIRDLFLSFCVVLIIFKVSNTLWINLYKMILGLSSIFLEVNKIFWTNISMFFDKIFGMPYDLYQSYLYNTLYKINALDIKDFYCYKC
jgi:hypothetical protein